MSSYSRERTQVALKDATRLLIYLLATVLIGALLAPMLFWSVQWFAAHGELTFLARYNFETFFHRALLIAAVILFWPLIHSLEVRRLTDLRLNPNPHWRRNLLAGFIFSAVPLLCCGAILLATPIFSLRGAINWSDFLKIVAATAFVPIIEETFFRGLILGVLLKTERKYMSIFITSVLYSVVHFLKAPEQTSPTVTWISGFNSIAHAFAQFVDPIMLAASFTTLFLIGWILSDARLRTKSLWLPIGLHAGWIFAAGAFNKIALRQLMIVPWLGKSLLVGIVPLAIACLTWLLMRGWLKYVDARNA
jgi:membrane protease YdiL (CAAX protease family)